MLQIKQFGVATCDYKVTIANHSRCEGTDTVTSAAIGSASTQGQQPQLKETSHLMEHRSCACVVAPLSATADEVLWMWHPEFPEMKADVVVVSLLMCPIIAGDHRSLKSFQYKC